MSYFKNPEIDFGTIRKNSSKDYVYEGLPTIPEVINLEVSCGCLKLKWDSGYKTLKVTYKAGYIPPQVQGNQAINKEITVYYKGGTSETLILKGIKTQY